MKKITLILAFLPVFCFAQNKQDSTKKVKFQYIQLNITGEQYDTVMYSLLGSDIPMQKGIAAIRIFKNSAQIISVYDTVAVLPKTDSVKNKKK